MHGRPRHVLTIAEQLKILERAIVVIAVLPPDAMAFRDRPMRRFPNSPVNKLPIPIAAALSRPIVRNFYAQIAVRVRFDRSDRQQISRFLATLERCLRHATAADRVARPAQAFVRRHDALLKPVRGAGAYQSLCLDRSQARHVLGCFVQAELRCSGMDGENFSAE